MEKIISALTGLVGAVSNNGKTDNTDKVIRAALIAIRDCDDEDSVVDMIHREKYTIAPDCATCLNPCGNTSDYDIAKLHSEPENVRISKQKLVNALCDNIAAEDGGLSDDVYRGIAYLGYELAPESYAEIIEKITGKKE